MFSTWLSADLICVNVRDLVQMYITYILNNSWKITLKHITLLICLFYHLCMLISKYAIIYLGIYLIISCDAKRYCRSNVLCFCLHNQPIHGRNLTSTPDFLLKTFTFYEKSYQNLSTFSFSIGSRLLKKIEGEGTVKEI